MSGILMTIFFESSFVACPKYVVLIPPFARISVAVYCPTLKGREMGLLLSFGEHGAALPGGNVGCSFGEMMVTCERKSAELALR